jgi:hypothetical protein
MQTPHRFRSKRQLWTYSGLGIETRDSAQYRYVHGQLQRTKKPQQIRGLNQNHNHEMKEIFKGAATRASCGVGPLRDFYVALLAKGMKPEMARLTLARKIAAIALTLWKKEERFDAGVSRLLCKRPGFVFGMGRRGRVSLPRPINVETFRIVIAQLFPRPACVPATES